MANVSFSEARASKMRQRYDESPIHQHMGMKLEKVSDGEVVVSVDAKPEHINGLGVIHGGVISTGLDSALLQSVRSRCAEGDRLTTVELKVNFLEAAHPPRLTFTGRVARVGGSLGVAHADAFDAQGKNVATAIGTIAIRRAK